MKKKPILVVDDEAQARTMLLSMLNRTGYDVDSASSGVEALTKFEENDYRLVIADTGIPEMSGIELLSEVKKVSPNVPVIMVTGHGTINNAVEAMQKGAFDYILKPFSSKTIEMAVKRASQSSNGSAKGTLEINQSCPDHEAKKIITKDDTLLNILKKAKNVASSNATILLQGESGTGKELLASFIHRHGRGNKDPYVAVNCAALPDSLAESELFGHEKGSFTGAVVRKMGKFEMAGSGTIVLDEISEMTMPLQAKILRVLQEREIDRLGGKKTVPIHARVIAISNVDLKKAVKKGKFRQDLFYRINVVALTIPPLRQRRGDISLLAEHFLEKHSKNNNKKKPLLSDKALSVLVKHDWRGNIRELENTMERTVLLGESDVIMPEDLYLEEADFDENSNDTKINIPLKAGITVKDMEKNLIVRTLKDVNDNRTHAAELLGISIRTLRNKLSEYRKEV
ncbi:MAG: sigma-54-dependent Fis family transcriptional regulator [Deltaproteobacteria bacterium]|nr:sigma-54-dependent Fis family transcriptional regulator [Deltaproteobacteria bacterium]